MQQKTIYGNLKNILMVLQYTGNELWGAVQHKTDIYETTISITIVI